MKFEYNKIEVKNDLQKRTSVRCWKYVVIFESCESVTWGNYDYDQKYQEYNSNVYSSWNLHKIILRLKYFYQRDYYKINFIFALKR